MTNMKGTCNVCGEILKRNGLYELDMRNHIAKNHEKEFSKLRELEIKQHDALKELKEYERVLWLIEREKKEK